MSPDRNTRKATVKKYKDALKELHANQEREEAAGIRDETPEYQRLNRAVLDAEKDIPWYRR
jgi:protein-arginine kinase activator protein McsA